MTISRSRQFAGLAGWVVVSFTAAAFGAMASVNAREFYAQLARPAWAPPGSVFGPVWTALYALMAIAAWLVWKKHDLMNASRELSLFFAQLIANALWSWIFFAWHLGALAFVEILFLWLLVVWTLVLFWRRSLVAGVLLVPYLAWVTFAALLCYSIWRLNPAQL
jgi:tryptophan-rich sensory protein